MSGSVKLIIICLSEAFSCVLDICKFYKNIARYENVRDKRKVSCQEAIKEAILNMPQLKPRLSVKTIAAH